MASPSGPLFLALGICLLALDLYRALMSRRWPVGRAAACIAFDVLFAVCALAPDAITVDALAVAMFLVLHVSLAPTTGDGRDD